MESEPAAAAQPQPQHLEALASANRVRLARWRVRRAVRTRRVSVLAVLEHRLPAREAELVENVPLVEILEWGHRIGEAVARRVMLRAEITPSPSLRLSHLSESRRMALVSSVLELAPLAVPGKRTGPGTALELEAMALEDAAQVNAAAAKRAEADAAEAAELDTESPPGALAAA